MDSSIFKYANFNVQALCKLASKLREGQTCSCDQAQTSASGDFNWTILIFFADNVQWVLRSSRRDEKLKCDNIKQTLLASEVATMRYIKANSHVPVLEVFAHRLVSSLLLTFANIT